MKGFDFVCACACVCARVCACVAQCVVLYVFNVSIFLPCLAFNVRYSQVQEETIVYHIVMEKFICFYLLVIQALFSIPYIVLPPCSSSVSSMY